MAASDGAAMADIIRVRLARRSVLGGIAGGAGLLAFGRLAEAVAPNGVSTLGFTEIAHGVDDTVHVPPGYRAQVLLRWGDPVEPGAPSFAPGALTAAAQAKQFGYNNDFVAFLPLPLRSTRSDHGLLVVNHEYTVAPLMFPGHGGDSSQHMTKEQVDIEMAAHGLSVVELRKANGRWGVVSNSRYNRRLTASLTEMQMTGPAAGHARLRTTDDPNGTRVIGTLNNCAGGVTPWGTVLSAEENVDSYFSGVPAADGDRLKRFGFGGRSGYAWSRYLSRFDLSREPYEANRFGWIVEFDPYDPQSVPKKRTALGRFKHEGAGVIVAPDGRVVLYMGDDARFEYLYRFVSRRAFDKDNRAANLDLLDDGVLSVARFDAEGVLRWLPLVWGEGPLTPANGFESVADLLIDVRRAADLVGATKMDRPEDVDVNPVNGRVYAAFTNNSSRKAEDADSTRRPNPGNPRAENFFGHILELMAPGDGAGRPDHTAGSFRWDIFILAGDPRKPEVAARYNPGVSDNGWFGSPDNLAFDPKGRLWIATDQGDNWLRTGTADGLWATDTSGPGRALTRMFLRMPKGAECCGPCFTPDGRTLFVAVQHPGADGVGALDYAKPATRWPDFKSDMPPRPSVIAITRRDGGLIGD